MSGPWRFFLMVEALLLVLAAWQIVSNPPLVILLLFGLINLFFAVKRNPKGNITNFQLILGSVSVFISLLNSPALWVMLIFAIIFVSLKGIEIAGIDFSQLVMWRKKEMQIVETEAPTPHNQAKKKNQWLGNQRIGTQVYEWDDINLNVLAGDTIIDLGNTLLPKTDNIIMIRKGIGRTRVLVPAGVGVMVQHTTLYGEVLFEEERTRLKNETLKIYSSDYDQANRRIKLITNNLLGDIEVIRV
ncbi:MAG: cell wall-active antibiotics response protein LiaF [Enterococcus sp.]